MKKLLSLIDANAAITAGVWLTHRTVAARFASARLIRKKEG